VPEEAPEPRDKSPKSGVRLVNRHGDIRLERLRISHWDGVLPRSEERRQSQVTLADGRTFNGDNPTVSTEAIGFELDVDDQRQVVLLKDLLSVTVHSTIESPPSPVLVTFPDGTCLSGEVVKIDDEQLSLQSPLHDH